MEKSEDVSSNADTAYKEIAPSVIYKVKLETNPLKLGCGLVIEGNILNPNLPFSFIQSVISISEYIVFHYLLKVHVTLPP